jgi:hypothetical protein
LKEGVVEKRGLLRLLRTAFGTHLDRYGFKASQIIIYLQIYSRQSQSLREKGAESGGSLKKEMAELPKDTLTVARLLFTCPGECR